MTRLAEAIKADLPYHIIIESSPDNSIFDVLCRCATSIMNVYRLQAEM